MPQVYDAFGRVPGHVPPSMPVRYWDRGLLAGLTVFLLTYPALLALAWWLPGALLMRYTDALSGTLATALHWLTLGMTFDAPAAEFLRVAAVHDPVQTAMRAGLALMLASAVAGWVMVRALVPQKNEWHVKGPQLLEGREALREAASRSLPPAGRRDDPLHLALHPALVLPKRHWSRHLWIYGSVGSGKTVILMPLVEQLVARDMKAFIYDVKGDFTSRFRRPLIVSPFDRRSVAWDVGRDVRTSTQAAAFAASIIPEAEGSGKFWSLAAQQVLTGAVCALQRRHGDTWGWAKLAAMKNLGAKGLVPVLQHHAPSAATLIASEESQTTASIMATLMGYTRVIDDLAQAWPEPGGKAFSLTDWIRDDYAGRKQVIVQAGPDPQLTRAYINAMINTAIPSIVSPALPDNESGRCLAFVLDELPSLGRLQFGPLVDKGRSKGVVVIGAMQDKAQLRDVYGPNQSESLLSMVGTHVVCQVQASETRDQLAAMLGKHKVAWRTHDDNATVHEESRQLVASGQLTDDLGFRKGKTFGPEGWGIRAVVQMGGDPLLLDFPGRSYPQRRRPQVLADWATPQPQLSDYATPLTVSPATQLAPEPDVRAVLTMSMDEVRAHLDRVYGAA